MAKRILVTGGAGFIGSHTAKLLFENGYEVIIIDNLSKGHQEFVKWGPLEKADIKDFKALSQVFEKYQPVHAVFHFASFIEVGESVIKPEEYYDNNLTGSLNLLNSCVRFKVHHLIFSSTAAVFGFPKKLPIREDHEKAPINPYGSAKFFVEQILKDYDTAYNLKSVVLRYFNAAGADPDPKPGMEIGEDHNPESHLIPLIFQAASGKRGHIGIFGQDYETPDGTAIRDYIHVLDLANAHLLGLKYLENGGSSDCFNLGNGQGYSVKQVIETAKSIIGNEYPVSVKEEPRRKGDSSCLISESRKALEVLNWKPEYPDIRDIISHAWKWYKFRFINNKSRN